MWKWALCLGIVSMMSMASYGRAVKNKRGSKVETPEFRAESIVPGETPESKLLVLVGQPMRVRRERGRVLYFYDVGLRGASMTATVSVRKGVVEWMTYFCDEPVKEVLSKYEGVKEGTVALSGVDKRSLRGGLRQLTVDEVGRGFVYSPRAEKVRVCLRWPTGKPFSEVGF